mmetsp:Transcript_21630/g.61550  ORF Transcript_21630/g.61550 Transcript_21630/m.61550 type:complete len:222 (-) Transcript_21630:1486-2151(-)
MIDSKRTGRSCGTHCPSGPSRPLTASWSRASSVPRLGPAAIGQARSATRSCRVLSAARCCSSRTFAVRCSSATSRETRRPTLMVSGRGPASSLRTLTMRQPSPRTRGLTCIRHSEGPSSSGKRPQTRSDICTSPPGKTPGSSPTTSSRADTPFSRASSRATRGLPPSRGMTSRPRLSLRRAPRPYFVTRAASRPARRSPLRASQLLRKTTCPRVRGRRLGA